MPLKKNDNGRYIINIKGLFEMIKILALILILVGGYYLTIGKINTSQAVQEERINTLADQVTGDRLERKAEYRELSRKIDNLKDLILKMKD